MKALTLEYWVYGCCLASSAELGCSSNDDPLRHAGERRRVQRRHRSWLARRMRRRDDRGRCEYDVPVIDLHAMSVALYQSLGFCPIPVGDVSASTSGPVGEFFCDDHTHLDFRGGSHRRTGGRGVTRSEHRPGCLPEVAVNRRPSQGRDGWITRCTAHPSISGTKASVVGFTAVPYDPDSEERVSMKRPGRKASAHHPAAPCFGRYPF